MKPNTNPYAIALMASLAIAMTDAADFDSGSTGALGDVHITDDTTVDMPADGIFHVKSLTIDANKTLRFNKNPLNTPVYILSQGDIVINGAIDLSGAWGNGGSPGKGGPGGFDGGFGGYGNGDHNQGGDGTGPGHGINNGDIYQLSAAYADVSSHNNRIYGNALLAPLIGGSGGAGANGNPGFGGGGGGGAILLAASSSITLNGTIAARGGRGANNYGAGSGGAVRLISPIVNGNGSFDVAGEYGNWAYGSQGRVRIDCTDRYSFRNLRMAGKATQGSQMFVFPPTTRRLDIIEAAGQAIPAPASAGVQVTLPAGSDPNRQIKVAASGFTANVPITVVVTPETGPSSSYDAEIPITNNKGEVSVPVVLSVGNINQIHAWTK